MIQGMNTSLVRQQGPRFLQGQLPLNNYWICHQCLAKAGTKRRKLSTEALAARDIRRRNALGTGHGFAVTRSNEGGFIKRCLSSSTGKGQAPSTDWLGNASEQWSERNIRKYADDSPLESASPILAAELDQSSEFQSGLFTPFSEQPVALITKLAVALREKDVRGITRLIEVGEHDSQFLRSIPRTTWSEIIKILNPRRLLAPLHKDHRSFSRKHIRMMRPSSEISSDQLYAWLLRILDLHRSNDICMTSRDYNLLLEYMAGRGNVKLAKALWEDMKAEGIRPSALTYAPLMEAMIWSEENRHRLIRSQVNLPEHAPPWTTDSVINLRDASAVLDAWKDMVEAGVEPNTRCYVAMLIALAHQQEKDAIYNILLQAFGIDVAAIVSNSSAPSQISEINRLTLQSSTTRRLLKAIPEIFGSINEIPTGLRIIDHLSTSTGIQISHSVWYNLARWTWIRTRHVPRESLSKDLETVEAGFFDIATLGEIMAAPPYNTTPNIHLRDLLFRAHGITNTNPALDDQKRWKVLLSHMEAGRAHLIDLINACRAVYKGISTQKRKLRTGIKYPLLLRSISQLRHRARHLEIKKRQTHTLLRRWASFMMPRLHIQRHFGHNTNAHDRWRITGLPDLILGWRNFLPEQVHYQLPTGTVKLQLSQPEEAAQRRLRKQMVRGRQTRRFRWIGPWMRDVPEVGYTRSGKSWGLRSASSARTKRLSHPDFSIRADLYKRRAEGLHDEDLFEKPDDSGHGW